jgi:hypothetical protein
VTDDRLAPLLAPMIAMTIAAVGIITLLIVDHGPWSGPVAQVATEALVQSSAAEQRAGAIVTPTAVSPSRK